MCMGCYEQCNSVQDRKYYIYHRHSVLVPLGKNIATSKEISFEIKDKASKDSYSIVYSVKEDSSKCYEAEIEIEEVKGFRTYDRTDKTKISIEWDKKSTDFELEYESAYGDELQIKGNLAQKGDKYIFVLTNIKTDGTAIPNVKSLELTITVDRNDPAPSVPGNFTEITRMDKRDFKHLVEDISDGVQDLWNEYFD